MSPSASAARPRTMGEASPERGAQAAGWPRGDPAGPTQRRTSGGLRIPDRSTGAPAEARRRRPVRRGQSPTPRAGASAPRRRPAAPSGPVPAAVERATVAATARRRLDRRAGRRRRRVAKDPLILETDDRGKRRLGRHDHRRRWWGAGAARPEHGQRQRRDGEANVHGLGDLHAAQGGLVEARLDDAHAEARTIGGHRARCRRDECRSAGRSRPAHSTAGWRRCRRAGGSWATSTSAGWRRGRCRIRACRRARPARRARRTRRARGSTRRTRRADPA